MPRALVLATLLLLSVGYAARATEPDVARDMPLFDFESPADLGHVQTDGAVTVELSTACAHSGTHSLAVHLADWAPNGTETAPGFPGVRVHMDGPRRDWSYHAVLEAWAYIPPTSEQPPGSVAALPGA